VSHKFSAAPFRILPEFTKNLIFQGVLCFFEKVNLCTLHKHIFPPQQLTFPPEFSTKVVENSGGNVQNLDF